MIILIVSCSTAILISFLCSLTEDDQQRGIGLVTIENVINEILGNDLIV